MAGVNKAIVVGHLGSDPELRYTQSGTPVTNFRLATTESWNKKDGGGREERTEWHNIVAWNRTAELCSQYLSKGRLVYIEGRLQTREWENREGHKQRTTEIVANNVTFLGGRGDGQGGGGGGGQGGSYGGGQGGGGGRSYSQDSEGGEQIDPPQQHADGAAPEGEGEPPF